MFFKSKKKGIILVTIVAIVIGISAYTSYISYEDSSVAKKKDVKAVVASEKKKDNIGEDKKEEVTDNKDKKENESENNDKKEIKTDSKVTQNKDDQINKDNEINKQKTIQKDLNKPKQPKITTVKKTYKANISDSEIKNLLHNGYNIQRKLEEKYLLSLQSVQISGGYYKKLPDRFKNKQSINDYCGKEFGLNKYYTTRYVQSMLNKVIRNINGKYYAIEGQSGPYIDLKSSRIISKNYVNNKLYITFDAHSDDCNDDWGHYKAILVKSGQKWLIDSCNFLLS